MRKSVYWSCFPSVFFVLLLMMASASQLNAAIDLEKTLATYNEECEEAAQQLVSSIEKEIELIRKRKDLNGINKQEFVNYATDLKTQFELHGYVPLAPFLRSYSVAYLVALQKARLKATRDYGKAINLAIKAKDEQGAADLLTEQKKLITVPVICRWDCDGTNFKHHWHWTMRADGSVEGIDDTERVWRFQNNKLLVYQVNDTWILDVSNSGKEILAKNLNRNPLKGKGAIAYPREDF
ncbi:MAG: hypothetical protein R3C11_12950 [Planctomycetaceae bacterium]